MDISITARHLRLAPSKLRRVFPQYQDENLEQGIAKAKLLSGKGHQFMVKVLLAAKDLAKNREMDLKTTKITTLAANKSNSLKRRFFQARGRVNRVTKRYAHLTVTISDSSNPNIDNEKQTTPTAEKTESPKVKKTTSVNQKTQPKKLTNHKDIKKNSAKKDKHGPKS